MSLNNKHIWKRMISLFYLIYSSALIVIYFLAAQQLYTYKWDWLSDSLFGPFKGIDAAVHTSTPRVNFPGCFRRVKPLQTTPNKFCGFVTYTKDTFCKKMGEIGQLCPQQGLKQSTPSYRGLPLPTRWSMQRPCPEQGNVARGKSDIPILLTTNSDDFKSKTLDTHLLYRCHV